MIEKQDFYHGATLVRLLDDTRCKSISRSSIGYEVNRATEIYLKYSAKTRSPWAFTLTQTEIDKMEKADKPVVIAFICGGDGICAITLSEVKDIFKGPIACISIKRRYREQYGVSGPVGSLKEKVHFNRINMLAFENNNSGGTE